MRAEVLRLRGGRRIAVIVAVAIAATVASALSTALLVGALAPDPLEASVVAVHRGSAAALAVALAVGLLVGADHRLGTASLAWMQLGGRRRLVVVAGVQTALAAILALASGGVALAIVGALAGAALEAVPLVLVAHVALMMLWSTWLTCSVVITRSQLVTIAVGIVGPVVVEPAVAGALAAAGARGFERLLPSTALRMLGELAATDDRVVLASTAAGDAWILPCVVVGWSVLLMGLAWRSAARAP
ncbi:hypothetical protein [Agrococcus jejuensis]|uniref:Uncharacterized protein n=1 Tax=Agrococcus jejuensis TaxID=399736 RepID=A0A1G8BLU8_9MICO|nr:hypothetical protein [Agrococcus jejuensis]SDH34058.1 hypothetical protein SAMN04489720_0986 [Agrococcus jejuensis]